MQTRGKVRATLDISADERPWNKAQALLLGALREIDGLGRDAFDIRWVSAGIRVAVNSAPTGCPTTVSQVVVGTVIGDC